jgi:hypothetical protein
VALAAVCIAAALCLPGCYKRVVGARGIGGETQDIQDPYQESGKLDRWLFGPAPSTARRGGSKLPPPP